MSKDHRFEATTKTPASTRCLPCRRSYISHPSLACRMCRKGKPKDWVAVRPKAVQEGVAP